MACGGESSCSSVREVQRNSSVGILRAVVFDATEMYELYVC
jgi:hypothetical protein